MRWINIKDTLPTMKWISVKDKLPPINKLILVFELYELRLNSCGYKIAFLNNEGCFEYGDGQECDNVTHWLPLPRPPGGYIDVLL